MGSFRLFAGVIIAAFTAVLASFPRIIRFEEMTEVAGILFYTFILSLAYWIIHHGVLLSHKWRSNQHRILLAIGSLVLTVALSLIFHWLAEPTVKPSIIMEATSPSQRMILLSFRAFILSGFIFFIIYSMELMEEAQKAKTEIEKLHKETLQAKLTSLKQQISPHFLFNTLNTISTLTKEQDVKEFIDEFSNVYRYLLSHKDKDLVKLKDEMEFVESYLYILKGRFESALSVQMQVTSDVMNKSIPPLAVHLLIENAIKHNVMAANKPLHIELYNDRDSISVRNNLQIRQTIDHSSGQGLSNLRDRYRLLADMDLDVVKSESDFIVKIPLL